MTVWQTGSPEKNLSKLSNGNQYIVSHAWTFLHKQKYSLIVSNNFQITVELAVILPLKSCKSLAPCSFQVEGDFAHVTRTVSHEQYQKHPLVN